jgi:hypothetical protein
MPQVFGAQRNAAQFLWVVPVVIATMCAMFAIIIWHDGEYPGVCRILWLATAAAMAAAALMYRLVRYRVEISEEGIRIRGLRNSIDLGRPRKLRCGQYLRKVDLRVNHLIDVPVDSTHAWVAVEGSTGEQVLFIAMRGAMHAKLDWPAARPPVTEHVLFSNAVALREAIGAHITAG